MSADPITNFSELCEAIIEDKMNKFQANRNPHRARGAGWESKEGAEDQSVKKNLEKVFNADQQLFKASYEHHYDGGRQRRAKELIVEIMQSMTPEIDSRMTTEFKTELSDKFTQYQEFVRTTEGEPKAKPLEIAGLDEVMKPLANEIKFLSGAVSRNLKLMTEQSAQDAIFNGRSRVLAAGIVAGGLLFAAWASKDDPHVAEVTCPAGNVVECFESVMGELRGLDIDEDGVLLKVEPHTHTYTESLNGHLLTAPDSVSPGFGEFDSIDNMPKLEQEFN